MRARYVDPVRALAIGLWMVGSVGLESQTVSPGQTANLGVFDANNKFVGFAAPINTGRSPLDRRIQVTISVALPPLTGSRDSVVLELASNVNQQGPQLFVWASQEIYYKSPNCTGQAYVAVGEIHAVIGGRFGTVGAGNVLFVSARDPGTDAVENINSHWDPDTACNSTLGNEELEAFAVNPTVDLDPIWDPPFKLR